MQLINTKTNIDFMGQRKLAMTISVLLLIVSVASLIVQQLNFGIDFTGGTVIEMGFDEVADIDAIRSALKNSEFDDAVAQNFGSEKKEVLIRVAPKEGLNSADTSTKVLEVLRAGTDQNMEMRRVEFVGPQVGEELKEDGGLAMIYALACIFIYIAIRFRRHFSFGAIAALVHDVLITLGVFSITQMDFDLSVLAAILAVIGYSLNDTIVVFDRIRENFRKLRNASSIEVINVSLNQTLSRTLMTSLTTLIVLVTLFFLGGEIIRSFSFALIVGVIIGTYSSLYVASPITYLTGVSKEDLMPVEKEGADAVV